MGIYYNFVVSQESFLSGDSHVRIPRRGKRYLFRMNHAITKRTISARSSISAPALPDHVRLLLVRYHAAVDVFVG